MATHHLIFHTEEYTAVAHEVCTLHVQEKQYNTMESQILLSNASIVSGELR